MDPLFSPLILGILSLAALLMASSEEETSYPDLADIIEDGATPEKIAYGFQFLEGPTWMPDGSLVFSDIPADTLYRYRPGSSPEVFRKPSHNANGNTLDPQGRLVTCEHGSRRVTRTESDGSLVVIADRYEGKRLNSPNDVAVKSNGAVYFTDPPYGIQPGESELGFNGVYRVFPGGETELLSQDFGRPNGLAFSPDETRLYIGDSERKHIRVFDVSADGTITNGRLFAEIDTSRPGSPDGMRVDAQGRLYCAGSGGIQIYEPSGRWLGMVPFPEVPANLAWGDEDGKTLYVTARTGLYKIRTKTGG